MRQLSMETFRFFLLAPLETCAQGREDDFVYVDPVRAGEHEQHRVGDFRAAEELAAAFLDERISSRRGRLGIGDRTARQ